MIVKYSQNNNMSLKLAFIDLETTSLDPKSCDIIELSVILPHEEEKDKIAYHFTTLLKPNRSILPNVSELTGITNKSVSNAPEFHSIANKLYDILEGRTIVGHNIEFDYSVLLTQFKKLGVEYKSKKMCTLKISKNFIPGLESYSLSALAKFFDIKVTKEHRAFEDAKTSMLLYEKIKDTFYPKDDSIIKFTPLHQKLIDNSPVSSGIIRYQTKDKNNIIPVEDIKSFLIKRLHLSLKNQEFLKDLVSIEFEETGSFIHASLEAAKFNPPLRWCIYQFKSKSQKIILKVGKVIRFKPALFYFYNKEDAETFLSKLKSNLPINKYIYRDQNKNDKDTIVKYNLALKENINKEYPPAKSFFIRSTNKLNNEYRYLVIKDLKYIGEFTSSDIISKSSQFPKINYKKIKPYQLMALIKSLKRLKQQVVKTDNFQEASL